MSLQQKQKFLLHHYAGAAALGEPEYRALLQANAHVPSAADRRFLQDGFDRCMAALESLLFDRVARGVVIDPISKGDRWIRSRTYWQRKLPAPGLINTRQAHRISELWARLQEHLPPAQRDLSYLCGIIHKSTGKRDIAVHALTNREADHLLDALADRLASTLSPGNCAADSSAVPSSQTA
jgi:hypothetical protein